MICSRTRSNIYKYEIKIEPYTRIAECQDMLFEKENIKQINIINNKNKATMTI